MVDFLQTWFNGIWGFFTNTTVPGLGVKFSVLAVGFLIISVSITVIQHLIGGSSGTGYRTKKENQGFYRKHKGGD